MIKKEQQQNNLTQSGLFQMEDNYHHLLLPLMMNTGNDLSLYNSTSMVNYSDPFAYDFMLLQPSIYENSLLLPIDNNALFEIEPYHSMMNDDILRLPTDTTTPQESSYVVSNNTSNKKSFSCAQCHRLFSRKYDVIRHVRVHTGIKPYACPCCHKRFARSDARARHFRIEKSCKEGKQFVAARRRKNNM